MTKGITNSSTIEAEIKRTMLQVSERRILLVDHTKFEIVSLVTFADLQDIDLLITDQAPPQEYFQHCEEYEVDIIVAEED